MTLLSVDDEVACHYNETKYIVVGILHTCSAGVSFLASLMVICIIILFRKLKFPSQRLIFYLSLSVALYSMAAASVKTDYVVVNHTTNEFCMVIAFVSQYTQWSLLLAVCVITFDILLRIVMETNSSSRCTELVYVLVIFVLPALFNWLPFLWNLYGISGDWCWIRDKTMNEESGKCDKLMKNSREFQFGLWYGPLFMTCCLILITYIPIVLILRKQRRRLSIYNPERIQLLRTMRNEIYSIIWYPVVFMFINIFPLTNRVVSSAYERVFVLWVLHAVISPLQGGFMALVYALDPETRRMLTFSNIRAALMGFCDYHPVTEYKGARITRERGELSTERTGLLTASNKV